MSVSSIAWAWAALLLGTPDSPAEPGRWAPVESQSSTYRIHAFKLPVVEMELSLEPDSTGALLVRGSANTVGVGSLVYPIDNRYLALLDAATGLPLWWRKSIDQADLQQTLEARVEREGGLVDYGAHGRRAIAAGASWFVAVGATLHLEPWTPGMLLRVPLEMEGRTLQLTLRGGAREQREVLGRQRSCIVVSGVCEELGPPGSNLLPRTDMLTHHLVDDDYRWRFVIATGARAVLAAVELEKPGSTIRAELVRVRRGEEVWRRRRGGRASRSRSRAPAAAERNAP